ncbi:MAG: hypothetical protein PHH40_00975 [Candidatus Moranbacteria bacterium]|nr:hypothetical protein [Candidatus Moranbacteria bacterium]MDD3964887.1 hypothetical protein [Candidatus Moranbacteria bacterium]
MHDPQIIVTKNLAFDEAKKLVLKDPGSEFLKYAESSHQMHWEEFLRRFGGSSVNHQERVAQAYNKYYLVLKKENQRLRDEEDASVPFETKPVSGDRTNHQKIEFHNCLSYY